MTGRRSSGAVLAACAAVLLSACGGSSSLLSGEVEDQVAAGLEKQVGGRFSVTCPEQLPAQEGFTFTCTAADAETGGSVSVTVTEDDDQGSFSWKVAAVTPS